jgi:hypothetical protein
MAMDTSLHSTIEFSLPSELEAATKRVAKRSVRLISRAMADQVKRPSSRIWANI